MKLESEGRPAVQNAHATDVYAAVSGLALPDHSFLILTRTRASFVQVAMQAGERFVIEHWEGPRGFRSVRNDFSRDEVARLLESYLAGGDAWRAGIQWRPADGTRDAWDTVSTVCAFAAIAVFLALTFSRRSPGGAGASGRDPMLYFSIAMLIYIPSALIDMRRFKQMKVDEKMRLIVALGAALIAALYLTGRWT